MYTHQFPPSSLQRLLQNDKSDQFKIIVKIKNTENQNEGVMIENLNQIIITTTINKARVISKTIDEMFTMDPLIKQFEFEIKNSENRDQIKTEEVIEVFQMLLKSTDEEIIISGDKQEIFLTILSILGEENLNESLNQNTNPSIEAQLRDVMNIFECEYEGDELSGIISCIRQMTGGNLNGRDIIKLSAGGTEDPNFPLTNIVKYDKYNIDRYFYNYMMPIKNKDGWIEFDFLDRKVQITSYTIRTSQNYQYFMHPKSWKIIGSNDQVRWDLIDIQNDKQEMNGFTKQYRYTCNRNNDQFYRYIRYVQLDSWGNATSKNYINLTCIEFFGSISSP